MSYGSEYKRRRSEPGVYFIQSLEREAFKIGAVKQNKVKFRLGCIKEPHELIFFQPCYFNAVHDIERIVHRLAELTGYERLEGEWFAGNLDTEAAAMLVSEV
jgi:hypothetical protein